MHLKCRERVLFIEAFYLHLCIGLLLKVIPFRYIPKLFSSQQYSAGSRQFKTPTQEKSRIRSVGKEGQSRHTRHNLSGRQSEAVELIKGAVQRAGKVSPWRNRCLVSSLAGRCMLRRRRISSKVFLGMAKNASGIPVAHAWLSSGDCELVAENGIYTILYTF